MNLNYTERDFSKIRLHRKRYRRQRAIARGWKKLCHWLRWLRYLKYLNPFRYLKRLDRYIISKFIGTYIYSIVLIISIAIVFDVNENLAKFSTYGAPLKAIVFDYYANFVPYFSNLFSPLFVFIAVIFFTSKLAGNSEIIAMLAAGVSFKRLLRPYMISAALIAVVNLALGAYVIPRGPVIRQDFEAKYKLYELEEKLPSYFLRISKSTILNTRKVYSITKNLAGASKIEFQDTYKTVYCSRNYYKALKELMMPRGE